MTQRLWGFDSLTLRHRARAERERLACKASNAGQYRKRVHFALDKHTLGAMVALRGRSGLVSNSRLNLGGATRRTSKAGASNPKNGWGSGL